MSRLRLQLSISLDGYTAGPHQSADHPMGVGAMRLHEWVFPLVAWRRRLGLEGGMVNESSRVTEEYFESIGATIMGRNMFGGQPGGWSAERPWNGWWGDEPPYGHPVFVLTHHQREPLTLGRTTFHFVTDGMHAALDRARHAAGGSDVRIGGGANAARQFLAAGLVDEMELNLAPVLLGAGERLFEGLEGLHGLELVRTIATPQVTHFRYARR